MTFDPCDKHAVSIMSSISESSLNHVCVVTVNSHSAAVAAMPDGLVFTIITEVSPDSLQQLCTLELLDFAAII